MNNRKLFILAVVTVAVILAAGFAARLRAPQVTVTRPALFPELAGRINDIATITIKGYRGSVMLQQQGDQWVLASAGNYPALFNKIKQNVVGMSELRIEDEKTDNPEFYDRLGVEGPEVELTKSLLITLQDRSGQTVCALIVGNKRLSASNKPGLYVRKPDSAKALLVEGALDISDQNTDWFASHLFDIANTRVREVRISHPRDGTEAVEDLIIRKESREQPEFSVNLPDLGKQPSTSILANKASRGLEEMRAEDVQALQNFTFPDNATITTTVTTFDGLIVTARLTHKDKTYYANFTFTADAAASPAPAGTGDTQPAGQPPDAAPVSPTAEADMYNRTMAAWVYAIPDFLYEALTTRPEQFRKPKLLPE